MFDKKINSLPTVSIIIPTYNAENNITNLIESLLNLDYPQKLLEILFVDNNSNDRTKEIIKKFPVELLEEKNIQSSYAARNKGIINAKNEILAFIDSDCIADSQWIKEGVKTLILESADLVGGKVKFVYSKHKTVAELYDSITNMQVEINIKEQKISPSVNLFVKSSLFDKIGMFPNLVNSGGDIQWTSKATRNGFSLVYAQKAIVKHSARSLKELLKKKYRVGTGTLYIWKKQEGSSYNIIFSIFRLFFPPRLSYIKKIINQRGTPEMYKKIVQIWFVAYLCKLSVVFGILRSLFQVIQNKKLN